MVTWSRFSAVHPVVTMLVSAAMLAKGRLTNHSEDFHSDTATMPKIPEQSIRRQSHAVIYQEDHVGVLLRIYLVHRIQRDEGRGLEQDSRTDPLHAH